MASRSEIARQDQASEQRRLEACAALIARAATPDSDYRGRTIGVLSALAEAIDAEAVDVRELRRKGWQSAAKTLDETAIVVRGWRDLLIEYTQPTPKALPQPADIAVSARAADPTELDARLKAAFDIPAPIRHIRTAIEATERDTDGSEIDSATPTYGNLCGTATGSFTHPGGSNCIDCHLAYAKLNDGQPYGGPGHVDVAALLAGRPEVLSFPFEVPADAATQSMDASALARIDSLPDGDGMINVTVEAGQTYVLEGATVRRVDEPITPTVARSTREEIEAENALPVSQAIRPVEHSFTENNAVAAPTVIEPTARRPARTRLTAAQVREHGLARQRGLHHRSVSQVQGFAECGTRAALSDLEVPAWWNVGGKAFHACAEEINRQVASEQADGFTGDGQGDAGVQMARWLKHFDAQIVEQCAATPEHHQDTWRAANRGSEHYDWWRVEGPIMVQKYVVWLSGMIAEGWRIATAYPPDGTPVKTVPVIEYETRLDVGLQVPNLSIIDLALTKPAAPMLGLDAVLIIDLKAGNSAPKDTFQLGVYGWCALAAGVAQHPAQVRGAYYRARKGELTAPMPVLDMHPWPDVVQRYRDHDVIERQGIYMPNVTSFCGGCGVRDLCPAQASS